MDERFQVEKVNEHGYIHYEIFDTATGKITHCDLNELSETINELLTDNVKCLA